MKYGVYAALNTCVLLLRTIYNNAYKTIVVKIVQQVHVCLLCIKSEKWCIVVCAEMLFFRNKRNIASSYVFNLHFGSIS